MKVKKIKYVYTPIVAGCTSDSVYSNYKDAAKDLFSMILSDWDFNFRCREGKERDEIQLPPCYIKVLKLK